MKFSIVSVGKLKERYWTDAQAEYLKRLSAYARVEVVEIPGRDPAAFGGQQQATARESEDIIAALPDGSHTVLLDRCGKELSSEQLAQRIEALSIDGTSSFSFIVGGSAGVSEEVRRRADEAWSFGRITLPHNLARIVLLEQLYRAFRILRGEPYHK